MAQKCLMSFFKKILLPPPLSFQNYHNPDLLLFLFSSLGVEPVDRDVMLKPPRDIKRPMITKTLLCNVLMSAVLIVTGTLWIFWREVSTWCIDVWDRLPGPSYSKVD